MMVKVCSLNNRKFMDADARDFAELVSKEKKKVLLVGVTDASRYVYSLLSKMGNRDVITLWVDKKYNFFSLCGFPTVSCENISGKSFDIIALSGKRNLSFFNQITEKYGLSDIDPYMLSTDADSNFMDDVVPWRDIKYTDEEVTADEIILMDPHDILSMDRLDIVIRYMAGIELLKGNHGHATDMYIKLSMSMNDGEEYVRPYTTCAYFSEYKSKKGAEEFLESFCQLLISMKEKGFDKKHFIPLSETGSVINGTHRIAAALVLGEKIYVKKYVGFGESFLTFCPEDLRKHGYSNEEIKEISDIFNFLKRGSV